MPNNLLQRLEFIAAQLPENQEALSDGHNSLSYRAMVARLATLAETLRELARQKNIRVMALHAGNSIDWVLLDLACQIADIVCIPLPLFFNQEQCEHCIRSAAVDLLISDREFDFSGLSGELKTELINEPLSVFARFNQWHVMFNHTRTALVPEGTQKITFTSGSTGEPKGVCLSSEHQWRVAESLADAVALEAPRHLCLLPLSTLLENIGGVYAPLLNGGSVMIASEKQRGMPGSSSIDSAVLLRCISDFSPHTLIVVPQLLSALLAASVQGWPVPDSLKFVAVGGAKVARELIGNARAAGIPAWEGYGLSECGSVVALNTPEHEKPGTVGRILPHCQVEIIQGEVQVSGACHLGYLAMPETWYPSHIATGDLGAVDGENYLSIDGRKKNLLISAWGRNIQPEWIESEITLNPLIKHCVLVGDAKPFLLAIIAANDEVSNETISQWLNKVNRRLPDYAQVKRWIRPEARQWLTFLSANGRAKRDLIQQSLASRIEREYAA